MKNPAVFVNILQAFEKKMHFLGLRSLEFNASIGTEDTFLIIFMVGLQKFSGHWAKSLKRVAPPPNSFMTRTVVISDQNLRKYLNEDLSNNRTFFIYEYNLKKNILYLHALRHQLNYRV